MQGSGSKRLEEAGVKEDHAFGASPNEEVPCPPAVSSPFGYYPKKPAPSRRAMIHRVPLANMVRVRITSMTGKTIRVLEYKRDDRKRPK